MHPTQLRTQAEEYLRLARGLSSHSRLRPHLIYMAEALERRARQLEVQDPATSDDRPH